MKYLIAKQFNYYDELKTTPHEQELSIGEYVDEILDDYIDECDIVLSDDFLNNTDYTADTFMDKAIQSLQSKKNTIIKNISSIFKDINEDDFDKNEFNAMKRALSVYLKRNYNTILRYVLEQQYSKDKINKLIINNEKIINDLIAKVKAAYDNVKKWLKQDAPDLKLAPLYDEDIHITDSKEFGSAIQIKDPETNEIKCKINVSKKILDVPESVLMNTLYHELCHCIIGQADEAYEKLKQDKYKKIDEDSQQVVLDNDKFQNDAHSDEIWNRAADIVSQHSGYKIQQYALDEEVNTQVLNESHVTSIVCYNCGWFKIYKDFDNDCKQAANDNFQCPVCRGNDTKIIYPGDNPSYEKNIIEDALRQVNRNYVKYTMRRLHKKIANYVENQQHDKIDFNDVLRKVDGQLATELNERQSFNSEQDFFNAYCKEHFKKFNERFVYDVENNEE